MDNQKFGAFITSIRKEKGWTQLELAKKINVTDKAVSKWERGLGFPDIQTIEPLAEALEVSLVELMRSERMAENQISTAHASEAFANMVDVIIKYQKKIERQNTFLGSILIIAIIVTIFLVDSMELLGFMFICLPIIFLALGIWLILSSRYRCKRGLPYSMTLIFGILALMYPFMSILFLCLAFMLGIGPVPT